MPAATTTDDFVADLPQIANRSTGADTLRDMLTEDSPHYAGLSVEETEWLRAHIYAALALSDRPETGLHPAREDLATSDNPVVLAGVARLLRAAEVGPSWNTALVDAKRRIEFVDIFPEFRFDPPASPCCGRRTCIGEIDAALVNEDAASKTQDDNALDDTPERLCSAGATMFAARLQDQNGDLLQLEGVLQNKPILLGLFYTRCMNPRKCSLTISRLGDCARMTSRFCVFGMTYDPAYDTPARLLTYGTNRQFPFSQTARIVRAKHNWEALKEGLQMRAGYGAATINAHAREVFYISQQRSIWRLPPDWLTDPWRIEGFVANLDNAGTQMRDHDCV